MTDRTADIQALQTKAERVRTALTQEQTRLEGLNERRSEVVEKLAAMNVTPENGEEKLAKLNEKIEKELGVTRERLDGVDL